MVIEFAVSFFGQGKHHHTTLVISSSDTFTVMNLLLYILPALTAFYCSKTVDIQSLKTDVLNFEKEAEDTFDSLFREYALQESKILPISSQDKDYLLGIAEVIRHYLKTHGNKNAKSIAKSMSDIIMKIEDLTLKPIEKSRKRKKASKNPTEHRVNELKRLKTDLSSAWDDFWVETSSYVRKVFLAEVDRMNVFECLANGQDIPFVHKVNQIFDFMLSINPKKDDKYETLISNYREYALDEFLNQLDKNHMGLFDQRYLIDFSVDKQDSFLSTASSRQIMLQLDSSIGFLKYAEESYFINRVKWKFGSDLISHGCNELHIVLFNLSFAPHEYEKSFVLTFQKSRLSISLPPDERIINLLHKIYRHNLYLVDKQVNSTFQKMRVHRGDLMLINNELEFLELQINSFFDGIAQIYFFALKISKIAPTLIAGIDTYGSSVDFLEFILMLSSANNFHLSVENVGHAIGLNPANVGLMKTIDLLIQYVNNFNSTSKLLEPENGKLHLLVQSEDFDLSIHNNLAILNDFLNFNVSSMIHEYSLSPSFQTDDIWILEPEIIKKVFSNFENMMRDVSNSLSFLENYLISAEEEDETFKNENHDPYLLSPKQILDENAEYFQLTNIMSKGLVEFFYAAYFVNETDRGYLRHITDIIVICHFAVFGNDLKPMDLMKVFSDHLPLEVDRLESCDFFNKKGIDKFQKNMLLFFNILQHVFFNMFGQDEETENKIKALTTKYIRALKFILEEYGALNSRYIFPINDFDAFKIENISSVKAFFDKIQETHQTYLTKLDVVNIYSHIKNDFQNTFENFDEDLFDSVLECIQLLMTDSQFLHTFLEDHFDSQREGGVSLLWPRFKVRFRSVADDLNGLFLSDLKRCDSSQSINSSLAEFVEKRNKLINFDFMIYPLSILFNDMQDQLINENQNVLSTESYEQIEYFKFINTVLAIDKFHHRIDNIDVFDENARINFREKDLKLICENALSSSFTPELLDQIKKDKEEIEMFKVFFESHCDPHGPGILTRQCEKFKSNLALLFKFINLQMRDYIETLPANFTIDDLWVSDRDLLSRIAKDILAKGKEANNCLEENRHLMSAIQNKNKLEPLISELTSMFDQMTLTSENDSTKFLSYRQFIRQKLYEDYSLKETTKWQIYQYIINNEQ